MSLPSSSIAGTIRLTRIPNPNKNQPPIIAGSYSGGPIPRPVFGDHVDSDIKYGVINYTPENEIIGSSKYDFCSDLLKSCPPEITTFFLELIKHSQENSTLKLLIIKLLYVYGMKKLSKKEEADDGFIAILDNFYRNAKNNPNSTINSIKIFALEQHINISIKDLTYLRSLKLEKFPHLRTASETARMFEILDLKHLALIPDHHKKLILKQWLEDIERLNIDQIGSLTKADFTKRIQRLKDTPSIILNQEKVFIKVRDSNEDDILKHLGMASTDQIPDLNEINEDKSVSIYLVLQVEKIILEDGTLDYMELASLNKDTLKDKLVLCELNDVQFDYVYKVLYGNLYSNTEFDYWLRKIQSMNESEFGLYKSKIQAGHQAYGKNRKADNTPCLSEILFLNVSQGEIIDLIPTSDWYLDQLNNKSKDKISKKIAIKNSALGNNNIVSVDELVNFFQNVKKFNKGSTVKQLYEFLEYCKNTDPRIVLTTINLVKNSDMSTNLFEQYLEFIESYLKDTDGNLSVKLSMNQMHLQEVVIPTLLKNIQNEQQLYDQEHGRQEKALKLFNLIKKIAITFNGRAQKIYKNPVYISKNRGTIFTDTYEIIEKRLTGHTYGVPSGGRGAPPQGAWGGMAGRGAMQMSPQGAWGGMAGRGAMQMSQQGALGGMAGRGAMQMSPQGAWGGMAGRGAMQMSQQGALGGMARRGEALGVRSKSVQLSPKKATGNQTNKEKTNSDNLNVILAKYVQPFDKKALTAITIEVMNELFKTNSWGTKVTEMEKWILDQLKIYSNQRIKEFIDIDNPNWVSFCSNDLAKDGVKKIVFCHLPQDKISMVNLLIVGVENGFVKCETDTLYLPGSMYYESGRVHYTKHTGMQITSRIKEKIKETKLNTTVFDSNTDPASSAVSSQISMSEKQEKGSAGTSASASAGSKRKDAFGSEDKRDTDHEGPSKKSRKP